MLHHLASAVCDVAAGVLAAAGIIKLFQPGPWVTSLRTLGLPPGRTSMWTALARVVGAGEVALALLVVLVGGPVAYALLAAAYAAFTAVSVVALRRGGASCGCFGARSSTITSAHVGIDAVIVVAAVAASVLGTDAITVRLDEGLAAGVAYVVFAALGAAAMVTAMTTAAELVPLRRRIARS